MLPIAILEKTATSILFELPAGKPDPKQKYTVSDDKRERVMQSVYKSNTCWYYIFNFLRNRIGKEHPPELAKEREVELICSQRRKAKTAHEDSLPAIAQQLGNPQVDLILVTISLAKAKELLTNKPLLELVFNSEEAREGGPSFVPFIEEFSRQNRCPNLKEFLMNKKFEERNRINMQFLSRFGFRVEKLFAETMTKQNGYAELKWEEQGIFNQSAWIDFFACQISAKVYGFKKSNWQPEDGIEGLINELKTKGPLSVGGTLGTGAYESKPFKMSQQISGRDIYAWPPGAKRAPSSFTGHSVLLVGAKKVDDKAYAYFIDCADPSDPKDRSQQRIYMISFTNLVTNMCDLHGRMIKDSKVGYAYHGNFHL